MYSGRLVFSQVMDHLPMKTFRRCVQRYHGNRHIHSFTCLDQFLCMAFAQLTFRDASAVPKMRGNGRSEDVIFFDGVFFEPSLKSIFFVP